MPTSTSTSRNGKRGKTPPTPTSTLSPLVPYDWQAADIAFAIGNMSEEAGALITSAPGAGKTLVTAEIIKGLDVAGVILIVAPQGTHMGAWRKTLVRQGVITPDQFHVLIGTAKGKKAFANLQWRIPGVYITTHQWFARQDWSKIKPDVAVIDEIHMAGAYGIATSKNLIGDSKKAGLWAKYRIGLSGTPWRNKFENAWVISRWIEPRAQTLDYYVWRLSACLTKPDPFAVQGRRVIGEKEPGKLVNSLTVYIQHLQRERCCRFHPNGFLASLPEPLVIERISTMTRQQATFYSQMESSLASSLMSEEGGEVKVHAEQFIVVRGMLRRCALGLPHAREEQVMDKKTKQFKTVTRLYYELDAISPKLDMLIEDMPSYEGRHTLVLLHSKQFTKVAVDRIAAAGYSVEAWDGDASKTKREDILTRFTNGELEVIVGVISAMGTGTDGLQEVCWNLSWLSFDDDTSNNTQGIGRLDRLGQKQRVVTRHYLSDGTIDVGFYGKQMQKALDLEASLKKEAA